MLPSEWTAEKIHTARMIRGKVAGVAGLEPAANPIKTGLKVPRPPK
jgi:hypothetical protein